MIVVHWLRFSGKTYRKSTVKTWVFRHSARDLILAIEMAFYHRQWRGDAEWLALHVTSQSRALHPDSWPTRTGTFTQGSDDTRIFPVSLRTTCGSLWPELLNSFPAPMQAPSFLHSLPPMLPLLPSTSSLREETDELICTEKGKVSPKCLRAYALKVSPGKGQWGLELSWDRWGGGLCRRCVIGRP